tara:strand:+ start:1459 stop:1779 length:321 start_codon:yes stop_codon:yes gene_type:complete
MKTLQFKNTLDEVEHLLAKYPEAKNNDFYLQWVWLKEIMKFDLPDIPSRQSRDLAGKMCSIRRARQKIQGNGKFLPTDKDILDRRRKWRNASPKESLLIETTTKHK